MSKHANETFELAHILTNTTESLLRAEVMINEKGIGPNGKYFIKTNIINRLNGIKKDILHKLGPEAAEVMKADVLNEETALQLREITNTVLTMSKARRDKVEEFAAQQLEEEETELQSTQNEAA